MSDDEADFNHRIVLQGKFRNPLISGHNDFCVLRHFVSKEGAVGPPFFSLEVEKRPPKQRLPFHPSRFQLPGPDPRPSQLHVPREKTV